MPKKIMIKPIGMIRTPYKEIKNIPIQGIFDNETLGRAELFPEYKNGLKDLDGFSHAILIYYFDKTKKEDLTGTPYLENETHGIFSIRSPRRPNHIGFSIVKLEKTEDSSISFSEVDMLDETPLLDIKPYISLFDSRTKVKNGWIEKHFQRGNIPQNAKSKRFPERTNCSTQRRKNENNES